MSPTKHLLVVLGEEGSEIAKECSKAVRFGLHDVNILHPDGPDNQDRIVAELNDLLGVVALLVERRAIPRGWYNQEAQNRKREKVEQFMLYAAAKGELDMDEQQKGGAK